MLSHEFTVSAWCNKRYPVGAGVIVIIFICHEEESWQLKEIKNANGPKKSWGPSFCWPSQWMWPWGKFLKGSIWRERLISWRLFHNMSLGAGLSMRQSCQEPDDLKNTESLTCPTCVTLRSISPTLPATPGLALDFFFKLNSGTVVLGRGQMLLGLSDTLSFVSHRKA